MIDINAIIYEKAKAKKCTICIGEGWDERVLHATASIAKEGVCTVVLLGPEEKITSNASELDLDLGDTRIIDPATYDGRDALAQTLFELRQHKGLTLEQAKELLLDVNYFGCMLAHTGEVDGFCSSCVCPTADLMRPALQILKPTQKGRLVSEVAVLKVPIRDGLLFMTDASLNIDPTPEQLAAMALNARDAVKRLGIEPRVALLSFSTHGSGGKHPHIDTVTQALSIVKEADPGLLVDGELQGDAALNPKSAARKCPDSPLKGDANVLVFPTLNASNTFGHLIHQVSDVDMIYTFIMGTSRPVVIYGRSSDADTIKNLTVVCAMQANAGEGEE